MSDLIRRVGFELDPTPTERGGRRVKRELDEIGQRGKRTAGIIGREFGGLKATIAAAFSLGAVTAFFRGATKAAANYQTAMGGVLKTVDFSRGELVKFKREITLLTREIPKSSAELLGIAAVAGQLGVKGVKNLTEFTKVIAQLSTTSDVVGAEGARQLAVLFNLVDEDIGTVREFADVASQLGSEFATSEGRILSMATELAKTTSQFGATSKQLAGLSAALTAMGQQPELVRTTIGRVFSQLNQMLRDGGKEAKALEVLMGRSSKEIERDFEENAVGVVQEFIAEVGKAERGANDLFDAFGLSGERAKAVLGPLSQRTELVKQAAEAMADSEGRLQKEFDVAAGSFQNQAQLFKNAWNEVMVSVGNQILPDLTKTVETLSEAIRTAIDNTGELETVGVQAAKVIGEAITDHILLAIRSVFVEMGSLGIDAIVGRSSSIGQAIIRAQETVESLSPKRDLFPEATNDLELTDAGKKIADGFVDRVTNAAQGAGRMVLPWPLNRLFDDPSSLRHNQALDDLREMTARQQGALPGLGAGMSLAARAGAEAIRKSNELPATQSPIELDLFGLGGPNVPFVGAGAPGFTAEGFPKNDAAAQRYNEQRKLDKVRSMLEGKPGGTGSDDVITPESFGPTLTGDDFVGPLPRTIEQMTREYGTMKDQIIAGNVDIETSFRFGLTEAVREYGTQSEQAFRMGLETFDIFQDSLSDGLTAMITGTKSVKEAFRDMAVSILSDLAEMIIRQQVFNALSGVLGAVGINTGTTPVIQAVPVVSNAIGRFTPGAGGVQQDMMKGLRPGQSLRVLENDELVYRPQDLAAMQAPRAGGGAMNVDINTTINVDQNGIASRNVDAGDGPQAQELANEMDAVIERKIAELRTTPGSLLYQG